VLRTTWYTRGYGVDIDESRFPVIGQSIKLALIRLQLHLTIVQPIPRTRPLELMKTADFLYLKSATGACSGQQVQNMVLRSPSSVCLNQNEVKLAGFIYSCTQDVPKLQVALGDISDERQVIQASNLPCTSSSPFPGLWRGLTRSAYQLRHQCAATRMQLRGRILEVGQ